MAPIGPARAPSAVTAPAVTPAAAFASVVPSVFIPVVIPETSPEAAAPPRFSLAFSLASHHEKPPFPPGPIILLPTSPSCGESFKDGSLSPSIIGDDWLPDFPGVLPARLFSFPVKLSAALAVPAKAVSTLPPDSVIFSSTNLDKEPDFLVVNLPVTSSLTRVFCSFQNALLSLMSSAEANNPTPFALPRRPRFVIQVGTL